MTDTQGEMIAVPLLWDGLDAADVRLVNQMIVQLGPPGNEGEFTLTLGQLHPPVLTGDEETNRATLADLPYVTVRVVAKVAMPVARVRELRDSLTKMLDIYEKTAGSER